MDDLTANHIYIRRQRNLRIAYLILFASVIVSIASITNIDIDLWGHLRFGTDFIQRQGIIRTDIYSYLAEGRLWINHEWLSEIIMAVVYRLGHVPGLVLLKVALSLAICTIFYQHLNRLSTRVVINTLIVLLGFALALQDTLTIRPQIFSFLGLSILLGWLVQAEAGNYRVLRFTPLLFVAWVNLHGGVVAGIILFIVWSGVHIRFHPSAWKKVIPAILVSLGVLFINPYGWRLLGMLISTNLMPRSEFLEWNPVNFHRPLGALYLLALVISVLGLILSKKQRSAALLVLFALLAVAPVEAVRHLALFGAGVVFLAGEHIQSAIGAILSPGYMHNNVAIQKIVVRLNWLKNRANQYTSWLAIVFLLSSVGVLAASLPNFKQIVIPDTFPVPVIQLLKQSNIQGRLVTDYSWGEMAIYHLSPNLKVNLDGRRETVYSSDIYITNLNFLWGLEKWDALLEIAPVDVAMLPTPSPTANLLRFHPEWEIVYLDERFVLFVNRQSPQKKQLLQAVKNFHPPAWPWYFP